MTAFRPTGFRGGPNASDRIAPGDLLIGGDSLAPGAITTVGAGTLTGAAIASGYIYRTGPVGGYTDTTDTASNILTALAGNGYAADLLNGSTFKVLFINTVAQAMTLAYGAGVIAGIGTQNVAASLVREYLFTVLNNSAPNTLAVNATNGSAVFTFVTATNQTAIPIFGPSAIGFTPGATVTAAAGIAAGTTLLSLAYGMGGVTGGTLSANFTGTTGVVSYTFGPTIKIDGVRSSTL